MDDICKLLKACEMYCNLNKAITLKLCCQRLQEGGRNVISIRQIMDELQWNSIDTTVYYNKVSHEMFRVLDADVIKVQKAVSLESALDTCLEYEKEYYTDIYKLLHEEAKNYIELPGYFDIKEFKLIDDFLKTVSDISKKQKLETCLYLQNGQIKFKQKLKKLGLEKEYYLLYAKRLKQIAINWCKENNLAYRE